MQDTLVIDSVQIAQWQAQNDFNYNRELVGGDMTFTDWLLMQLRELLSDLLGGSDGSSVVQWGLIGLAVGVLGVAAWYLWRYHPGLFHRQERLQGDGEAAGDTIYGIDFDSSIARSLAREDYREAVRLVYLQTLKSLTDARLIDWQPYKTPTQYVRELSSVCSLCSGGAAAPAASASPAANPAAFRLLTAHFLRVRYGNFPATRPLYDELCQLRKEVTRES